MKGVFSSFIKVDGKLQQVKITGEQQQQVLNFIKKAFDEHKKKFTDEEKARHYSYLILKIMSAKSIAMLMKENMGEEMEKMVVATFAPMLYIIAKHEGFDQDALMSDASKIIDGIEAMVHEFAGSKASPSGEKGMPFDINALNEAKSLTASILKRFQKDNDAPPPDATKH